MRIRCHVTEPFNIPPTASSLEQRISKIKINHLKNIRDVHINFTKIIIRKNLWFKIELYCITSEMKSIMERENNSNTGLIKKN